MSGPIYGEFLSSDGRHRIVTTTWIPEGEPKAVLQIVHGMREHMGRYTDFAEFLIGQGYIVCGHDHIGHGRTAMEYGIYGFFGREHGARTLVDDSNRLTKQLAERYPRLPIFLLGHSMGSFVSRLQVLSSSDLLSGYICMATGGDNPLIPYLRGYAGLMSKTRGPETSSVFINKSMDVIFKKCLDKGEAVDAWISHNPETIEAYAADPFTRFYFTNQGYADLMDLQIASNRDEWYYRMDSLLPMILVSGSDDPIGGMGKDVPKIHEKLLDDSFMVDVSYKIYENMRHEILNELDNKRVYNDLLDWMNGRILT